MSDIVILDDQKEDNLQIAEKQYSIMERINDSFSAFQNLWVKEKVVFYRLLATMIDSGISIIKAVSILELQEKNPVMKNILFKFSRELKEWKSFSDCLLLYPNSFSLAEVGMIESWEKTWRLNKSLLMLADQVENLASISGKLRSAMMYPLMVILVVIWVVIVMMVMVVPKLLEIFDDKSKLPPTTQALMTISDFFRDYWWLVIWFMVLSTVFISIWKKTPSWRYLWDKFLLRLPIFGEINKKIALSKFARVLSGLMSSGVSIVESLRITSDAVWNEVYRQRIMLMGQDIKQWLKMWESLEWDPFFPPMMVHMIQVWEQTAKVDSIILKIADFYEEQVDNTIWVINKLLEPIILVFLAVVVGFIAMAIMQPIMWLADQVSQA